ncbi:MAG: DUF4249 domain-containing protein [Cyclobacteriaceae bacterium]
MSITIILMLGLSGCVQEFSPEITQGEKRLVVEGRITNGPGPYRVKLSETEDLLLSEVDSLTLTISGAVVEISDDWGNSEILSEIRPGIYETDPNTAGIIGEVGRTYQLTVITEENKVYKSVPETLVSVPEIESLSIEEEIADSVVVPYRWTNKIYHTLHRELSYAQIRSDPNRYFNPISDLNFRLIPPEYNDEDGYLIGGRIRITSEEVITPADSAILLEFGHTRFGVAPLISTQLGYRINVSATDVPGEQNFLQWIVTPTFSVNTQPKNFTLWARSTSGNLNVFVNVPKDCCSQCYISYNAPSLNLWSDNFRDGAKIQQPLDFIPFNHFNFDQRLHVQVRQLSLTPQAHFYWNAIKEQAVDNGGLFDSAPSLLVGNMYNPDDAEDVVLGYFSVSAEKTISQFIQVNPEWQRTIDALDFQYFDDCRNISTDILTSVTEEPDFWE